MDARNGDAIRTLQFGSDSATIAFRPDGDELAILAGNYLRLINPVTGAARALLSLPRTPPAEPYPSIAAIAYSPDGHQLAVITAGRQVVEVNEQTRRVRILAQSSGGFYGVAFTPDGREIAVSPAFGSVQVFSARSRRLVHRLSLPSTDGGGPVAVSPDGRRLAVGITSATNGYVQLWNTRTWRPDGTRAATADDFPVTLTYDENGAGVVVGSDNGTVEVVPASGGAPTFSSEMRGTVYGLAATPTGQVAAIDAKGDVRIWQTSAPAQEVIASLPQPASAAERGQTVEIMSSTPGAAVYSFNRRGIPSQPPLVIAKTGNRTDALSSDGRLLFDAPFGGRARPALWDTLTRRIVKRLPRLGIKDAQWAGGRLVLEVGGSATGNLGYFDALRTYDPTTGRLGPRLRAEFHAGCDGSLVAPSEDERRAVVSDSCGTLGLYDLASGRLMGTVKPPDDSFSAAISSDDRLIADTFIDGQGEIRDASTLRVRARLIGHVGSATVVGFADDNRWLVTVGIDHTMRVWRTSDGALLRTVRAPTALIAGDLLPFGRVAVIGSNSETYVYDICDACGNARSLLRLSNAAMRLPLTPIDRSIIDR